MYIGTKEIQNIEFGNKQVQSVWYGIKKIWENYIAGLFRNGTLIKSWNNLVSEGYLSVSDHTVFSTTTTRSFMSGDLFGDKNVLNVSSYTFGGQVNRWGRIMRWGCNLLKVIFPDCNYIGSSAFLLCSYLTTANFPNCSYIGISAFYSCSFISSINFTNCNYIDDGAFNNCTSLTTVSFPNCSYIGSSAFNNCTSLTTVSFPNCSYVCDDAFSNTPFFNNQLSASGYVELNTDIGNKFLLKASQRLIYLTGGHTFIGGYAFESCSSLTSVDFTKCSYIGSRAFYNCSSLSQVNISNCSYIGDSAFWCCTPLTSISFPNCSYIGDYAFWCCTSLASISFPNCSYIGMAALAETSFQDNQVTASGYAEYQNSYNKYLLDVSTSFSVFTGNHTFVCGNAFVNCLSLIWVSLPNCMYIHTDAFRSCASLSSIYLMSTSVCTLKSGAFTWAGITSSTGSIIVPSSLVSAYKSASEWSYFSTQIFGA